MSSYCAAKTKNGKRCRARPINGDAKCYSHSERTAEQRAKSRSNGGRMRAVMLHRRPLTPFDLAKLDWWSLDTIDHVTAALRWLVRETAASRIDARTSNALVQSIGALRSSITDAELDARLDSIERRLAAPRRIAS